MLYIKRGNILISEIEIVKCLKVLIKLIRKRMLTWLQTLLIYHIRKSQNRGKSAWFLGWTGDQAFLHICLGRCTFYASISDSWATHTQAEKVFSLFSMPYRDLLPIKKLSSCRVIPRLESSPSVLATALSRGWRTSEAELLFWPSFSFLFLPA